MSATYPPASKEVNDLVARVMEEQYPELHNAGVTVLVQMAHAARDDDGQAKGPALKHNGYPAAGQARITNLKDRMAGIADCRIWLDGDEWDSWPDDTQEGTVSHELAHFIVTGKTDDADRPKLKMRKHDFHLGGFNHIVSRYGQSCFEAQLLRLACMKQGWLFADAEAEPEPTRKVS